MKKIYSLALLMMLAVGAFAQRDINLEVTLVSPTASTTISAGNSFNILAVVKNLGPDSLRTTDSTLWFMSLSGQGLPFTFGSTTGVFWLRFNRSLKVNDTMQFNFPNRVLNYSQNVDSQRTMCFNALPTFDGGGNDTVADNDLTNNTSCVTLTFKANFASNVDEIFVSEAGVSEAVVYPNPANKFTNVHVNMAYNADVFVRVLDITGRTVLTTPAQFMEKGDHKIELDLQNLQSGMYIYQVQMGKDVASGKIMINK